MAAKDLVKMDLNQLVYSWLKDILWPEKNYFWLAIIYGIGIALLGLATPISVQLLINSIANTALPVPLFTLAAMLFGLLIISGLLSVLRIHLMELYRRRFMARLVADLTMRVINAADPFFQDDRRFDLFNRYFEMVNMQKAVPSLLIGGFTIILGMIVGFIVTSFYHPFFLAFNLVLIALLWAVWAIWSKGAMKTSIILSHEKYNAAHFLETVGASNGFYKSARHIEYALAGAERVTANYVKAHSDHFGYQFPQTIAFYFLYAAASAGLLALGGWLVIQEQLSIGQLVAAELILSGVFAGMNSLYSYLDDWYDLVASIEELSLLYGLKQEAKPTAGLAPPSGGALEMRQVRFTLPAGVANVNLQIAEGSRLVCQGVPGMEREFADLLKRLEKPQSGLITLGGVDIALMDPLALRSDITVLDRAAIVESTIADYLRLANPDRNAADQMAALKLVGLEDRLALLPDGIHTRLSSTGAPFTVAKMMQLKLAAAILAAPRIMVLSPLFDTVARARLKAVFDHFRGTNTTILYFSNRPEDLVLDGYLWLGLDRQLISRDRATFDTLRAAAGRETVDGD
ncbi:ABC transporter ATP-binding protein [Sandarakinorhabdus sp. AAP62]|uniref:ABC transporter ATP-binding protein n=1 Tax=Sandarakinorhabdus sp. AAP62 TaxID=1248916 RepID=UPI0003131E3B|nr:ABC transporter ATP-binding protein [Sandarakinorhabdus sp. AAP62]